jgi:hypothetical protein
MAVETTRRAAHRFVGLTRPAAVKRAQRLALLAGAIANKWALRAKATEATIHIRRFALGTLLTLAWIGLLVWFLASAVQAVM